MKKDEKNIEHNLGKKIPSKIKSKKKRTQNANYVKHIPLAFRRAPIDRKIVMVNEFLMTLLKN